MIWSNPGSPTKLMLVFVDNFRFGEVAMQPPCLTAKPRKAVQTDKVCNICHVFTSWYVRHTTRYGGVWIGHSIPVRQLIYALNPHKRELNAFTPVSHTRFGFVKSDIFVQFYKLIAII